MTSANAKRRMNLNEVYEKVNTSFFANITDCKKKGSLTANFRYFLANHGIVYAVSFVVIIALVGYAFKFNWKILLLFAALFLVFTIALIMYNTYRLNYTEKGLKISYPLRSEIIPYDELYNIFLYREKTNFLFFIPYYTYTINILCADPNTSVRHIWFSTIMVNKKAVEKFMNTITVEELPEQKEFEEKTGEREKRSNIVNKIVAIFVIIFVVIYILAVIFDK